MLTPQPPALLFLPLPSSSPPSRPPHSFPSPDFLTYMSFCIYLIGALRLCQSWERKLEDNSGCHLGSSRV